MEDKPDIVTLKAKREVIDRRRRIVVRLGFVEDNKTPTQLSAWFAEQDPPEHWSVRTIENDFRAIREDSRRYLQLTNFDARVEIGTVLARYDFMARHATQKALDSTDKGAATWMLRAIQASQAKTALLQDIGLVDRQLGTVLFGRGQSESDNKGRLPNVAELIEAMKQAQAIDLTPDAEREWLFGSAQKQIGASEHGEGEGGKGHNAAIEAEDSGRANP